MSTETVSKREFELLESLEADNRPDLLKAQQAAKLRYEKELERLLEAYKVDWTRTAYNVASSVEQQVIPRCPQLERLLQEWESNTKARMQKAVYDHLSALG
jgi:hypothetical protein